MKQPISNSSKFPSHVLPKDVLTSENDEGGCPARCGRQASVVFCPRMNASVQTAPAAIDFRAQAGRA
jgi:hypothetical protein